MIRSLILNEAHKLHTADPFFVAAEFSDLIDAATYTFRPEPLLMHGLPLRAGVRVLRAPPA